MVGNHLPLTVSPTSHLSPSLDLPETAVRDDALSIFQKKAKRPYPLQMGENRLVLLDQLSFALPG